MQNFKRTEFIFGIALIAVLFGCSKGKTAVPVKNGGEEAVSVPSKAPAGVGIRIAWDFSTLKKVSAPGPGYCGYPRLVQLHDLSLLAVYEGDGNIVCVKSIDLGATWSAPITIARNSEGLAMTVPDILELKDHSILVCYNPRPGKNATGKKFGIRTQKSYDGGETWTDERLLYEADFSFQNGCWEPSAIQLPDGEIQLFFANEGDYLNSDEQNISLVRSVDNGLTWSKTREIASFRPDRRDGMPSPLLLQNGTDIVISIEDNGFDNFKPYTIRNTIADNWGRPVGASSPDRNYALAEPIADNVYAGAPYLRQLKTGQTILSYQGTEERTNNISFAEMKVVIGDTHAKNFTRKTSPFVIAANKSGLWNSLAVLSDNTVIALTSTNSYSTGNTEIWMIKGHVIPELTAGKEKITVDGNADESSWITSLPVFIGHKSPTQLRSGTAYDDQFLYVYNEVKDSYISRGIGLVDTGDGVSIFIDAQNKSFELPDKGVFKVFLSAKDELILKEGNSKKWVVKTQTASIRHSVKTAANGYVQEIAIPWVVLGGKPGTGSRIGYNISLVENTGSGLTNYIETMTGNSEDKPYTWSTLTLK